MYLTKYEQVKTLDEVSFDDWNKFKVVGLIVLDGAVWGDPMYVMHLNILKATLGKENHMFYYALTPEYRDGVIQFHAMSHKPESPPQFDKSFMLFFYADEVSPAGTPIRLVNLSQDPKQALQEIDNVLKEIKRWEVVKAGSLVVAKRVGPMIVEVAKKFFSAYFGGGLV